MHRNDFDTNQPSVEAKPALTESTTNIITLSSSDVTSTDSTAANQTDTISKPIIENIKVKKIASHSHQKKKKNITIGEL